MSYVDSNLMNGERVMHRARLHKVLFVWPGMVAFVAFIGAIWLLSHPAYNPLYGLASFAVVAIFLLSPYVQYITSEYAVTNKRVIVKVGLIRRQTLETLLQKIEAISVDQSVLGRILNFGTITIIGTGGTRESFMNIADPLSFRRAVQEQTDALDNPKS
jgi:uncharacterized membrane protein YdbT with pleckstrin-like domain